LKTGISLLRAVVVVSAMLVANSVMADGAGTIGTAGGGVRIEGTGISSAVVPSVEILFAQAHLAGSCAGAPFDLNTFINVDAHASADVRLLAQGVGLVEEFTDDTGSNIGPFNGNYSTFHILGFGGGLAPHSAIQLVITTYSGPSLTGNRTYSSAAAFDCTSGVISSITNSDPTSLPAVPVLDAVSLAALAGMLASAGMLALRRRPTRIK
jgi:hypothetical protein